MVEYWGVTGTWRRGGRARRDGPRCAGPSVFFLFLTTDTGQSLTRRVKRQGWVTKVSTGPTRDAVQTRDTGRPTDSDQQAVTGQMMVRFLSNRRLGSKDRYWSKLVLVKTAGRSWTSYGQVLARCKSWPYGGPPLDTESTTDGPEGVRERSDDSALPPPPAWPGQPHSGLLLIKYWSKS